MNKRIIIFDFDGTIADSLTVIVKIANRFFQESHLPQLTQVQVLKLRQMTYAEIFKELKIPWYKLLIMVIKGRRLMNSMMAEVAVHPNLIKVFQDLKKHDYKLAILTSNSKKNIEKFIAINHLNFFDYEYCSTNLFGKAHSLNRFIRMHSLKKEDVIYVGDEIRDIEACKKVGIPIISVSWGLNTKEVLAKYSPDYLVDKPEEILKIV